MGNALGRNEPCFCKSGKKYKNCCLKTEEAAAKADAKLKEDRAELIKSCLWAVWFLALVSLIAEVLMIYSKS